MSKKQRQKKLLPREAQVDLSVEDEEQEPLEQSPFQKAKTRSPGARVRYGFSKLLSNLRFSLTLRIAIHYAMQLLHTTLTMMFVVLAALSLAQIPTVNQTIDAIAEVKPAQELHFSKAQLKGLPLSDAYLMKEPLPSNLQGFFQKINLAFAEFLPLKDPHIAIYTDTLQGPLVVVFSLKYWVHVFSILFWTLICLDLYRMVYFLRHRNRLNRKVLKPISDMVDAAAALSAHNLSDRISIEGTKNELKDLASVINLMLDRIERSYNSQKQFVSDASHELRTPIAVIQGYASMLERWGKTDKAVLDEGIAAISQETTAMKELVERLLFLARHDKKTLMLEMEVFDPTEIMSSVHRDAKLLSPAHKFELKLEDSCTLNGDKGMLKQLMRILVDNAIKYTPPEGKVTLCMRKEGEECVLSVSDTGAGISAQEMPRIFDRFYRSDKARKAQSSGHGLGLSIARIIVVAHEGKLNVRSKEGVGTTFSAKLPITQEQRT